MKLSSTDTHYLAKQAGLNPKGIERLISSQRVAIQQSNNSDQHTNHPTKYEIGLNLPEIKLNPLALDRSSDSALSFVLEVIGEYSKTCPLVLGWLCSGGFDANKCPSSIDRGKLIHACRTAGRLRAKLLRCVKS